ncbi:RICIN domain-containing protein [Streptomyces sp. ActVer]|uniref:RICIN domain-containing protein n=1 Tax=Streptomyces sp. ActVer TaxID=3014558 RepID=UPI0022B40BCC|nr:RICIN domain-containing protein [Streptomyces sp. ActVer]MCZ4512831.1 RICIN domain-containing protein [Streptomyces sp. ActVer]
MLRSTRPPGRRIPTLISALALVASAATAMAAAPPTKAAGAAALPTGWATVVNAGSGKCVDARAAGTADGTAVQQYACNSSRAQQWQLRDTSDGRVRVDSRGGPSNSTTNVANLVSHP